MNVSNRLRKTFGGGFRRRDLSYLSSRPSDQASLDAAVAKRGRRQARNLRLVAAGGFR